jgi:hypothetical protein
MVEGDGGAHDRTGTHLMPLKIAENHRSRAQNSESVYVKIGANLQKYLLIFFLVFAPISVSAERQPTAIQLLEFCKKDIEGFCLGYVVGALQALEASNVILKSYKKRPMVCAARVQYQDVVNLVLNEIENRPDLHDSPPEIVIIGVFNKYFCKET